MAGLYPVHPAFSKVDSFVESVASSDESVCSAPSSATAASHSFQDESAAASVQLPVPAVSPKMVASTSSSLQSFPAKSVLAVSSAPESAAVRACATLEIFAGSCRLSKSLRGAGFHTVAVDVKDASGHPPSCCFWCHTFVGVFEVRSVSVRAHGTAM